MKKKIIMGVMALAIMGSVFAAGVFAANKMTLIVNGSVATADPVLINGTTYVPLRAAAELLGAEVRYDGSTKTVYVDAQGKESVTPTTPKTNTSSNTAAATRSNPAEMGNVAQVKVSGLLENYTTSITVLETIRGAAAWDIVKNDNRFNSEPAAGHEYMLAKVSVKIITNEKKDTQIDVSSYNFTLVSSEGRDYESKSVALKESIRTSLYEGASHTGWVAFEVKTDDANPLITYGRSYDGSGGGWFKSK